MNNTTIQKIQGSFIKDGFEYVLLWIMAKYNFPYMPFDEDTELVIVGWSVDMISGNSVPDTHVLWVPIPSQRCIYTVCFTAGCCTSAYGERKDKFEQQGENSS